MAKEIQRRNPITKWEMISKNPVLFATNNKVVIAGRIENDFKFSHRQPGTRIKVFRTKIRTEVNGKIDVIPVLVPEMLLTSIYVKNMWVAVAGAIKIYRGVKEDRRRYKDVSVMASECYFFKEKIENVNIVFLKGELVKDAFSKHGKKAELTLKVERRNSYARDYVPCVAYGKSLERALQMKAETKISLFGRFQSREYTKRSEFDLINRTAFEIATNSVRVLD